MSLETAGFVLVWLFVMGYTLYRRFWRPPAENRRDSQARLRELGEAEVLARFQRRRRRCVWFGLVPALAGILTLGLVSLVASGQRVGRPWGTVFGIDTFMLVFAGLFLFGAGLVFALLTYRCPACGELPGGVDSLPLNPVSCRRCGVRLAPAVAEQAAVPEQGTLGALFGRVGVSVERDRLVVMKNRLPRLLEFLLGAGFLGVWYFALFSRYSAGGPAVEQVGLLVFALFPVVAAGPTLFDLLAVALAGDVFMFYRATDRVVRNGRVICPVSQVGGVVLRGGQEAVLSLALQDGTRIRVDRSWRGDLASVAKAIAEFVGVEVVTESRAWFRLTR